MTPLPQPDSPLFREGAIWWAYSHVYCGHSVRRLSWPPSVFLSRGRGTDMFGNPKVLRKGVDRPSAYYPTFEESYANDWVVLS